MNKKSKMEQVMHEFKEGKLYSSSGKLVTDRKQAIAIGLSYLNREHYQGKKYLFKFDNQEYVVLDANHEHILLKNTDPKVPYQLTQRLVQLELFRRWLRSKKVVKK